jgi:hypothetical protein
MLAPCDIPVTLVPYGSNLHTSDTGYRLKKYSNPASFPTDVCLDIKIEKEIDTNDRQVFNLAKFSHRCFVWMLNEKSRS